ncbi:MAG: glycine betaine ABC transporter substrate-binding protein [Solirubrobacteraceae bacterium]
MIRRFSAGAVLAVAVIAAGVLLGVHLAGSATAGTTGTVMTGTTATVMTQPPVSAQPTTTPAASVLPGHGRPTVALGDMNTPEQFVLGQLYETALSQQGYDVTLSRNIGTTATPASEAQQALEQGILDLYPQYLDVWDRGVAGRRRPLASAAAAYTAGQAYATAHGFRLLTPSPGSDTYTFAVTSQFARQNRLGSLAQLLRLPALTFGVPLAFAGLARAERAYSFQPGVVEDVGTGAQYGDLTAGEIQVAYANTTDPQFFQPGFTLLRDPQHVFGFGNIVPVTTPAVIRSEGPAFVRTIDRVDALLTTSALRGLEAEVLFYRYHLAAVVDSFLQGNGLIPPPQYVPSG